MPILEYDTNNPKLINSLVCFVDILGFSSLIMNKSNDIESSNLLLKNLNALLKQEYAKISIHKYQNAHFKSFTDNIVIAYPISDDGEGESGNIFINIGEYQLNMVLENYFLRGGLAIGNYFGDDMFSYGPALIDAHLLESQHAEFPRIILSTDLTPLINQHLGYYADVETAPQSQHLLKDEDGVFFINYLYSLKIDEYDYENNYGFIPCNIRFEKLIQHKLIIIKKLQEYREHRKIYQKYLWVAQYHNYFCNHFIYEKIENFNSLLIPDIEKTFYKIFE